MLRLGSALAVTLAAVTVSGCGGTAATSTTSTPSSLRPTAAATPTPTPTAVAPLLPTLADLHVPPVAVPLRFIVPTLGIDIPVVAVGMTRSNAMDAPEGKPGDPNWEDAFWYRGGVEPGRPGVATIAGHLDDVRGRPAAFWNIRQLVPGDIVEILDQRTSTVAQYRVAERDVYDLQQIATRDVLTRLFGADAVDAKPPQPTPDGLPHLTLITCTGRFVNGQYDHRLVLYAVGVAA